MNKGNLTHLQLDSARGVRGLDLASELTAQIPNATRGPGVAAPHIGGNDDCRDRARPDLDGGMFR